MARISRGFPGHSNTHAVGAAIASTVTLVAPAAAVGAGVGVNAAPGVGAVPSDNGANTGVGVNPTVQAVAGANATPTAGLGSGAGTGPTVTAGANPLGAGGVGVGVRPAVAETGAMPLAAQGVGVGWAPIAGGPVVIPAFDGLAIFLTPQVRDRPPYLPDSNARQVGLMRHFENRLRGVLVWLRNDGTYVVDTPCNYESAMTQPAAYISDDPIGPDLTDDFQGLTDSNVNYPWNPFPGTTNSTIPGSYAYNVNWDQTTQDFILNPYLVQWWEGGAENVITQAQALQLTAAGFGDCIASVPDALGLPAQVGVAYGEGAYGAGAYGEGFIPAGELVGAGMGIGSQPDGQGPYGSWAING